MAVHSELAAGKWEELSLFEQMGNIGSEISRARQWRDTDEQLYHEAVTRALELLDFTIQDPRWRSRLREITRARELVCDAMFGGKEYGSTFEDLDNYFLEFAIGARTGR